MFVLTSSWAPKDSQLALSTKFVPLLHTILEEGNTTRGLETQYTVGDKIDSNAWKDLKSLSITRPDGVTDTVPEGQGYGQTHEPGLYTVKANGSNGLFGCVLGRDAPSHCRLKLLRGLGSLPNALSKALQIGLKKRHPVKPPPVFLRQERLRGSSNTGSGPCAPSFYCWREKPICLAEHCGAR